eukprot:scaffold321262_cov24-Tisochrysis_lutea.AAC.1
MASTMQPSAGVMHACAHCCAKASFYAGCLTQQWSVHGMHTWVAAAVPKRVLPAANYCHPPPA